MSDVNNSTSSRQQTDIIKILVATDCHLGYAENDPIIGEDSFVTFKEIMILANEKDVDMILLGGDLFHHNNPSQNCMNKCLTLLRQFTMGDKPVYLQLLSDARDSFGHSAGKTVNYLDDNLNVSIPVFSIHGNHDDPSTQGQFSAMDTLSSAGLVNYFGKWTDLDRVEIRPILLQKGKSKLALYGLSHIKDDRLCRLYIDNKVVMVRPMEEPDSWFNLFVLHQNRADRGPKKFISESQLPEFLDLIIWGHEHDCQIEPEKNLEKGFYVVQPGSSVPTSLSEGETRPKHVALLKIHTVGSPTFKLEPIPLRTTRPFVWDCLRLMDVHLPLGTRAKADMMSDVCTKKVEEMIAAAEALLTGHPDQPKLPLIRLRCDYDDETQMFNCIKFGQMYHKRVANPNTEVIRFKKVLTTRREPRTDSKLDMERLKELYGEDMEEPQSFTDCVNHIVQDYFLNQTEDKMLVLSVKGMGDAVEKFLEKDSLDAIDKLVKRQMEKTMLQLQTLEVDEENIAEEMERLRDERDAAEPEEEAAKTNKEGEEKGEGEGVAKKKNKKDEGEEEGVAKNGERGVAKKKKNGKNARQDKDSSSGTDEYDVAAVTTTSTRGRRSAARKQISDSDDDSTSGRKDNSAVVHLSSDDDDWGAPEPAKTRGRGRGGRGRPPRGGRGSSSTKKESPPTTTSRGRGKAPRGQATLTPRAGLRQQTLRFTSSLRYQDGSEDSGSD